MILTGVAPWPTDSTSPGTQDVYDRQIVFAQELLRSVYPELTHHGYLLQASKSGRLDAAWPSAAPLDVTLISDVGYETCMQRGGAGTSASVCKKEILSAAFEFDEDQTLKLARIGLLPSAKVKLNQVYKLVEAHPEWTDLQIAEALKRDGARFSPADKDSFVNWVQSRQLTPFTGKLAIESVEFRFRHLQDPRPLPELYWAVDASSVLSNGARVTWTAYFEPYGGSLTDLYRDSPKDKAN